VTQSGNGVFHIAKQIDRTNQNIVGENCVRNDTLEIALNDDDDDKMKAWVEHYARLLNVEFKWPSNELSEVNPTASPPPSVCCPDLQGSYKMKCHKAADPSGIITEMLKVKVLK